MAAKKTNYFEELAKLEAPTEKKGNLTYISWADAWDKLKREHPDANFTVYQAENGMPYFADASGGFVKVGVTVEKTEHIVFLPIMDNYNKSVPKEKLDTFIINKSIQRAMAKGIAMHGMGLYVYRGEDLPTIDSDIKEEDIEIAKATQPEKGKVGQQDKYKCSVCQEIISKAVSEYSIKHHNKPLCMQHQKEENQATGENKNEQ